MSDELAFGDRPTRPILIGIVAVLLVGFLCCTCSFLILAWQFGDVVVEQLSPILPVLMI